MRHCAPLTWSAYREKDMPRKFFLLFSQPQAAFGLRPSSGSPVFKRDGLYQVASHFKQHVAAQNTHYAHNAGTLLFAFQRVIFHYYIQSRA